jgi:hypothetical protein
MKTKELPKWFDGELYPTGDTVTNPFSGDKYELNAAELSMYDFIMGTQFMIEQKGGVWNPATSKLQQQMAKGLSWFRSANAEAYRILLD